MIAGDHKPDLFYSIPLRPSALSARTRREPAGAAPGLEEAGAGTGTSRDRVTAWFYPTAQFKGTKNTGSPNSRSL